MTHVNNDKTTCKYTSKFKQKHPDYFKNYYIENKHKYNINSRKKQWWGIEIFGTTYVFDRKIDMNIKKISESELQESNVVRIKVKNNE